MARTKSTPVIEDTEEAQEARAQQVRDAHEQAARFPAGNSTVVPERDARGQLTRPAMEAVIRGGGSVSYKGQIHTRVETLPSTGDLSEGDVRAEEDALAALDDRAAALERERTAILHRRKVAAGKAKEKGAKRGAKDEDEDPNLPPGTTQLPLNPNDLNPPGTPPVDGEHRDK